MRLVSFVIARYSVFASAGVLLWEIFTGGDSPYSTVPSSEVVERICYRKERLARPLKCPDSIYKIMSSCWAVVSWSQSRCFVGKKLFTTHADSPRR